MAAADTQEDDNSFMLNQPTTILSEVLASVESEEFDESGALKKFSWVCGKLRRAIEHDFLKKLKPKQRFKLSWIQPLMGFVIEELHIRVDFTIPDHVLTDKLDLWVYRHLRCYVRFSDLFESNISFLSLSQIGTS